jgi:single-strand DNA-binding protein
MISATVAGRIARDAEVKQAGSATICEFSVPHQDKKDGPTTWVRCSIFGDRGVKLAQYLTKGTSVAVSGRLTVREYEGKNGKGVSVEIKADDIALLGGGARADEGGASRYGSSGHGANAKHTGSPDEDPDLPF